MATALFILGHAGSGKTKMSKRWIKHRLKKGEAWCLIDKDDVGEILAPALMTALGLDPLDRDSAAYKEKVRDLEYNACLVIAARQLKLGINVVLPGPWNRELESGKLFDAEELGFPAGTHLAHVYRDVPLDIMQQRIIEREDPRDAWKLNHWAEYVQRLIRPAAIDARNIQVLTGLEEKDEQLRKIADACQPSEEENVVYIAF